MILNITEEQKQAIESRGHMVVEFKMWCKKYNDFCVKYGRLEQIITDVWNAIIFWIQKFVNQIVIPCFDKLNELLRVANEKFCELFDTAKPIAIQKRQKYLFIRSIKRDYQPRYFQKPAYHRRMMRR